MSETVVQGYEAGEDVLYQTLEGEIVLLNLKSQRYFSLDTVGSRIWQLLLECGQIEPAADRLCGEYDIDKDRVTVEIESLANDLCSAGLLQRVGLV